MLKRVLQEEMKGHYTVTQSHMKKVKISMKVNTWAIIEIALS